MRDVGACDVGARARDTKPASSEFATSVIEVDGSIASTCFKLAGQTSFAALYTRVGMDTGRFVFM